MIMIRRPVVCHTMKTMTRHRKQLEVAEPRSKQHWAGHGPGRRSALQVRAAAGSGVKLLRKRMILRTMS